MLIYLVYSLLATAIQESVSTMLQTRASTLYKGIRSMLTNTPKDRGTVMNFINYLFYKLWIEIGGWFKSLVSENEKSSFYDKFYDHPTIKNYGENLFFKKPSYLTAENFSTILIETIKNLEKGNEGSLATFPLIKSIVDNNNNNVIDHETRAILIYHLNEAAGDLDVFKHRMEKWYNDTMDRVSGWYKRTMQFQLLIIGLALAITLNIDSAEIATYLSDNKPAREQMVKLGQATAGNQKYSAGDSLITKEVFDSVKVSISKINTIIGLGWGDFGSSDSIFRKHRLKDSLHWGKPTKQYIAYTSAVFQDSANAYFSRLLKDTVIVKSVAVADTAANKPLAATPVVRTAYRDSLLTNKESIIAQRKFALLYDNDDFDSSLKRSYVWYRIWSWRKVFGFMLTAWAIGLGAPFWFDLLNKFVKLRTAVKPANGSGSSTPKNTSGSNDEIDG
ncbi:hypothetical protein [Chitinophaga sp. MM2321]|uniref:hypothetical protein n=1 Tax=Chitinophaga sp. MM2321 TaxID=3137178 RepID=UPI0032D56F5D